jgi:hypothetical protein
MRSTTSQGLLISGLHLALSISMLFVLVPWWGSRLSAALLGRLVFPLALCAEWHHFTKSQ